MDERSELRFDTTKPVMITVLDESAGHFQATVANYSHSGMKVVLDRPLRFDAPVKIEWGNRLLLGEVCYSRSEEQGFSAGISLLQGLFDVAEARRHSHMLLGESADSNSAVSRPEAR